MNITFDSLKPNIQQLYNSGVKLNVTKREIILTVNRVTAIVRISSSLKRVSSFSLGVYVLRTFYPIVSLGVSVLLRRGIVGPIPDAENKGCIG